MAPIRGFAVSFCRCRVSSSNPWACARTSRIGAALLAIGLLGVDASVGSRATAAERWTYAASDHFEVYTAGSDKRAREILVYFERVHAFFADFLKLAPKTQHPTRLIVFSSAREYEPYRLNEFAIAHYAPGPDRDYIVMRSFNAESYPIVVHEYAHLVARHANAAFPLWLNEGLAEFFSTITPEAGQMNLGLVPRYRLSELREGGAPLGLDRLLEVTRTSPEYSSRTHAGMFYAQSWALAHMILTSDAYRPKSDAILTILGNGGSATSAFSAIYGKTTAEVERDLHAYVRRARFNYFTLKYRDPKIPAVFPTRPVPTFEAGLVTANLLASNADRAAQARAAYEKLAQERPDDRDLLEARGLFEIHHGNAQTAQMFLTTAIAAKSENPAVYRWAASMADSPEAQEALLSSALSLVPHDVSVRLAYAAALKLRADLRGAREALVPLARVQPEHAFMYFELQASISLELGDHAAARAAVLRAKAFAEPGRQSAHVEDLIRAIDEHDVYRAAREAIDRTRRTGNQSAGDTPLDRGPAATAPTVRSALTGQALTVAEGRFSQMICNTPAVIEVETTDGLLRLAIDDPLKVVLQGTGAKGGAPLSLTCGPQNRQVRVGYAPGGPGDNDLSKTVGILRLLDLR